MSSTVPLLTVVVPTRHRDDLLARCLERLAPGAQSLPFERYTVLVTDDGTQSTAEGMVSSHFPWVHWVKGPCKGRSHNRNNGAALARTDWIAFVDDDCVPGPGWLAAYVAALEQGRPAGITVYEGKTTCEEGIPSPLYEAPVNLTGGALWSCNMVIAAETFRRFGGFDVEFSRYGGEDMDLYFRLRAAGEEVRFVPEAVVDHPARPRARGSAAAETFESVVQTWYKTGNTRAVGFRLVRMAASMHARHIAKFPPSWDSVRAVGVACVMLSHVARNVRSWDKRYRQRYEGTSPVGYPFPFW